MLNLYGTYKKLKKSYSKNLPELIALLWKQYPQFVFENNNRTLNDEIPVFTLHSVYSDKFEEQLQFLYKNNYRTLTADEFYECIIGSKPIMERTILLTFDDGWKNLYTVVYPLLKKYKMYAVCFLIPGLIPSNGEKDLGSGNNKTKPFGYIPDSDTLCGWDEIKEMHDSGIIDFQSHSMYHDLVFTSPDIQDFFYPAFDDYPLNFNVPLYRQKGEEDIFRNAEFGSPIYKNTSRFAGKKRYFDDETLRNKCVEHVKLNGGVNFFKKNNWHTDLLKIVKDYRDTHPDLGYYENEEQLNENLFFEFSESKKKIEGKLPGKIVRHFCYPWWIGSDTASEISKEAGYISNFWGIIPQRRTNKKEDNPYKITRLLSEDFIFRLPGEGRKSLLSVLREKFSSNQKRLKEKLFRANN